MKNFDEDRFRYDVAVSFLGKDEGLATEIVQRLQDSLRVYIYTREQEQIAGRDGEQVLNTVFEHQTRVAVVLHRGQWGSTPFTRIEETAIRNRAFEQGWDFAIFVPLGDDPLPRWLPRNRIWPNLARWGIEGLTAVLESKVLELGGSTHSLSPVDRAAQLQRELTFHEARTEFFKSSASGSAAKAGFDAVVNHLKVIVEQAESATQIGVSLEIADRGWIVQCRGMVVSVWLSQLWMNRFERGEDDNGADLTHESELVTFLFDESLGPDTVVTETWWFDLHTADRHVWVDEEKRLFTDYQVAEHVLDRLLAAVRGKHIRG